MVLLYKTVDLFNKILDLFSKIVDLFNKIVDLFDKFVAFSNKIVNLFGKTVFERGVLPHLENPPGYGPGMCTDYLIMLIK